MEDRELDVARLGCNVLIDLNNGDRLSFVRLHSSASIKMGNSRCSLSPLINAPYGSTFELQRGSLVKVAHRVSADPLVVSSPDAMECDAAHVSQERDNRSLVDNNTAQKLSADEILRMRKDCVTGKEIVNALIANSTTFESKTLYSQEKYKKKKQKKYAPFFVMRKPSSRRICEVYLMKSPQKIGFLRMDSLALMLSLANVGAHAEVLVMDMVGGLLTAAVAERMGGFGSVCSVYSSPRRPPLDIVGLLNLSQTMACRVFSASIWDLTSSLRDGACTDAINQNLASTEVCKEEPSCDNNLSKIADAHDEHVHAEMEEETVRSTGGSFESSGEAVALKSTVDSCVMALKSGSPSVARYGKCPESEDLLRWAKHGFTGLIIGAPELEPWSVVQQLLPLLSPSSPFVIYHRYLQPLAECMHELQAHKMAVALEIIEPWLREYQVLPSRTHPHMQMNANGGFLLTGVKITSV